MGGRCNLLRVGVRVGVVCRCLQDLRPVRFYKASWSVGQLAVALEAT